MIQAVLLLLALLTLPLALRMWCKRGFDGMDELGLAGDNRAKR